jgi:hypothetical protein
MSAKSNIVEFQAASAEPTSAGHREQGSGQTKHGIPSAGLRRRLRARAGAPYQSAITASASS